MEAVAYKVIELPEIMVDDDRMAQLMGKDKRQIQRLLREMAKDPIGRKYISHDGGRSTDPHAFKAWLLWYEGQKYKSRKEPFKYNAQ